MEIRFQLSVGFILSTLITNLADGASLGILSSSRTINIAGAIQPPPPPPVTFNQGDSFSGIGFYGQSFSRGLSIENLPGFVSSTAYQTSTVASSGIDYASVVSSSANFGFFSGFITYSSSASSGLTTAFSVSNEVDFRIDLDYRFAGNHSCPCIFPVYWNFSLSSSVSGVLSNILITTDPGGANTAQSSSNHFVVTGTFKPQEIYTLVYTQRNDSLAITDTEAGTINSKMSLQLISGPTLTTRFSHTELCYDTVANRYYRLEYSTELAPNTWVPLHSAFVPGTGGIICTNDAILKGQARRFYRVMVANGPGG
jgi:hypothetical protein